ncbi:PIR protein, putative [Plasmodium sp.]|nr:PIR protein, putative [Plasmodium sp.]
MKFHYINILLFAVPLNILVHNQRNHKKTILHTPKTKPTKTHRTLFECELYAPSNYENDPEMKEVVENFNRQMSERFREYDERIEDKKKQCKEQCDKDIQKIILKDKIEKQLSQQFCTLQTNIDTNDIPICICEKSVADKVEKKCLRCTQNWGGLVAPSSGVLGGIAELAINVWKTNAIAAAITAAEKSGAAEGAAKGAAAGVSKLIELIKLKLGVQNIVGQELGLFFTAENYNKVPLITGSVNTQYSMTCLPTSPVADITNSMCTTVTQQVLALEHGASTHEFIGESVKNFVAEATKLAESTKTQVTSATTNKIITEQSGVIEGIYNGCHTAIITSIIAILIIVLIMVIIYFILSYLRKKKMKKKLQYIKLLK